jgi:hypothetical protein
VERRRLQPPGIPKNCASVGKGSSGSHEEGAPLKTLLVTLVFAGIACAQDDSGSSQQKAPEPGAKESAKGPAVVCRLESVTWNPVRAEMTWLVSIWNAESDSDRPVALERYAIHLDAAVMEFKGEARAFDPAEAKRVRLLMDMISTYSVQSTVWWDHGSGSEPDGQVIPVPNDKDGTGTKGKSDDKDEKKENPKAVPKPAPAVLRGPVALVAPVKQADGASH